MSLLGTQVYANPATPIWLSAKGGTIEGNLEVKGSVHATNQLQADNAVVLFDPSGSVVRGQLDTDGGGTMYVRAPSFITFSRTGNPPPLAGNTTLTLSAPGSGLDNFTTNFLRAIGPIPTSSIPNGSPSVVTLTTGSPTRVGVFTVTTPYALLPNAEYDVQAMGTVLWDGTGSAPASGDLITITFSTGSGANASISTVFYPGNAPFTFTSNVGYPFNLRSRLIAPASPSTNLTGTINFSGASGTGNIVGRTTLLDIVRVA